MPDTKAVAPIPHANNGTGSRKLVAWVVSHCSTNSKRENYVEVSISKEVKKTIEKREKK
jgi:hypothetical protein